VGTLQHLVDGVPRTVQREAYAGSPISSRSDAAMPLARNRHFTQLLGVTPREFAAGR